MFELTLPSPQHRLKKLSSMWGVELWVKRDDLIPQFYGGNKTRKNIELFKNYVELSGIPDVVITNGGINSNHARVVALMARYLGSSCELVLHGQEPTIETLDNLSISKIAGARCHIVESNDIRGKIEELCRYYETLDQKAFVIPGGAHALEAAKAYEAAVRELPFEPDYIVHASGTGGTQAGLLRGIFKNKMNTNLIGISVARNKERGVAAIEPLLAGVPEAKKALLFLDEFTFGGYARTTAKLSSFVSSIIAVEGLPFDETYTGKAMYGLRELIKHGEIKRGAKVVFWHTGGGLNFQGI